MGKRIIAVGRIDRRSEKARVTVVDNGFIATDTYDGRVKMGWQRPIPKKDESNG